MKYIVYPLVLVLEHFPAFSTYSYGSPPDLNPEHLPATLRRVDGARSENMRMPRLWT